jgi:hypothetical protein
MPKLKVLKMYKVRIRFDKVEEPKAIRIEGYTRHYPEEGVDFSIYLFKEDAKIFIDLGRIIHIKHCGDMLLVQTEYMVAEVWILENRDNDLVNIISINPRSLLKVGGKIIGGRSKRAYGRRYDITKLLQYAKSVEEPASPNLKLIPGELKC